MRLISHVVVFIGAVCREWVVLVTGSFVIAVISIYERMSHFAIPNGLYWFVIFASLFVAFFRTWEKERMAVEGGLGKQPVFIARRRILELRKQAEAMKAHISRRKWLRPTSKKIDNLKDQFSHALEIYMLPNERSELLAMTESFSTAVEERVQLMMDGATDEQVKLHQRLTELLAAMNKALIRIDVMRE